MDEADPVDDQPQVESDAPPEPSGSVRIFENAHCHIDRLADGQFLVHSDTRGVNVGVLPADRLDLAHALANRVAGPPRKPKAR
jgi:hypothetical protein